MGLVLSDDEIPIVSARREEWKIIWRNNMSMMITFEVNTSANAIIY